MFYTRVVRVCLICLLLCKEDDSSPVSLQLLRGGMGTMLANFHMCGIMLVLRTVFNMLVRNASPTWPKCFRCLILNLSGPCEFSMGGGALLDRPCMVFQRMCVLCI